jgi:uncharacterized protein YuzE
MIFAPDPETGAFYVYAKNTTKLPEIARTLSTSGIINIDLDRNGEIIGVELIPTSDVIGAMLTNKVRSKNG